MIQKGKEDVYSLAKKLEPKKWLDILAQKELPEVLSKSWLGNRDEVVTFCDSLYGYFRQLPANSISQTPY